MFIPALLIFFLASVIARQELKDKTPLPADLREVFEEFNSKFKWNDHLAREALREANETQTVRADLKVTATRDFWKTDQKPLGEKLRLTMKARFDQRTENISDLPEGTQYGCNGISATVQNYTKIRASCVYCKIRSSNGDCYNIPV